MGSNENIQNTDNRFQGLLESYLRLRTADGTSGGADTHLDEDTLTAMTEGNLSFRESKPVINHLGECSFCRHRTTELVRLEMAFEAMDESRAPADAREPATADGFFSGILARLFGTGEAAVFAHEEKDEDKAEEKDENTSKDKTDDDEVKKN